MDYTKEQIRAMNDLCKEFKNFRNTLGESERLERAKKSLLIKKFSFAKHLKNIAE